MSHGNNRGGSKRGKRAETIITDGAVQSKTQHSELKLLLTRLILCLVVNTSAAARRKQAPLTT